MNLCRLIFSTVDWFSFELLAPLPRFSHDFRNRPLDGVKGHPPPLDPLSGNAMAKNGQKCASTDVAHGDVILENQWRSNYLMRNHPLLNVIFRLSSWLTAKSSGLLAPFPADLGRRPPPSYYLNFPSSIVFFCLLRPDVRIAGENLNKQTSGENGGKKRRRSEKQR